MEDTIDVTLPISGSVVTIRNYTTKADDIKADAVLYAGVDISQSMNGEDTSGAKVDFPLANMMASSEVYVYRLVASIDGDSSSIKLRLEDLKSKDYQAVNDAVDKIVAENSPKVKTAKDGSMQPLTAK